MATARKPTATPARSRKPAAPKAAAAAKVPANAKKPADHRPAKDDVKGRANITIEWHGHTYVIEAEAFDDLEVVDLFMQIEDTPEDDEQARTQLAVRVARKLLHGDVYKQYLKNERGEDGRVKLTGFLEFFNHLMEQVDGGNS